MIRRTAIFLLVLSGLVAPFAMGEGPLRIVATGGRMGTDSYTVSGSVTAFRHRTPHMLGGPVDEIQIGFMNWAHDYTKEIVSTTDLTIEYAWLERASTGQVVPLTFGGTRQFVMPANSVQAYFPADPIPSTVWTGSSPARDEVFWVNILGSVPPGSKIYLGTPSTWSGAKFLVYDPADPAYDSFTQDTTGSVPYFSGQTSRTKGLPLVFTGRYSEPGHLSVIGIGDSILDGTGDSVNPVPVITGFGFFNRAAVDAGGTNAIAMFNLTRHGAASSSWNSPLRMPKFLALANVVVEEFGTNDIGTSGAGNTDDLKTRLDGIWNRARNAGVQYILRTQLLPRTTDPTYTWSTKEGQTPNSGWGTGEKSDIMNDYFDTALSSGKIDAVVNTLNVVSDPTDKHYWLTDGSSKYITPDGTHVSVGGNAMLASVLRADLLTLNVDANVDTYSQWSQQVDWQGADSSPEADPDQDGFSNLMAYALDLQPMVTADAARLPAFEVDSATADGPWLVYTYRRNPAVGDLSYRFMTSDDLMSTWSSVFVDGINTVEEIVDADPDGDGSAELMRLRVKVSPDTEKMFLKMQVSL